MASLLLGPLSVSAGSVFDVVGGLRGFEGLTSFALVPAVREGLFWLQSTEAPDCTFLLGDPFVVVPGFAADVSDTDRGQLGLTDPTDALVLCVITLPGGGPAPFDQPTMNLRAPLILNLARGIGRQVVSPADALDFRAPISLDAYGRRQEGGIAPVGR